MWMLVPVCVYTVLFYLARLFDMFEFTHQNVFRVSSDEELFYLARLLDDWYVWSYSSKCLTINLIRVLYDFIVHVKDIKNENSCPLYGCVLEDLYPYELLVWCIYATSLSHYINDYYGHGTIEVS